MAWGSNLDSFVTKTSSISTLLLQEQDMVSQRNVVYVDCYGAYSNRPNPIEILHAHVEATSFIVATSSP